MNFAESLYIQSNPPNVYIDLSEDLKDLSRNFLIKLSIRYPFSSGINSLDNGNYILFYNYETLIAWYDTINGIGFIPKLPCHIQ